jgi:AraC-like DNA-binding protein
MVFLTYVPKPPLADFVELFWYCDGYSLAHARERVLPTGDVQLVVSLRDAPLRTYDALDSARSQSYRGPLLCGPRSEFAVIDTTPLSSSMGVQFKPGGAFPFLGVPAGELHNLNVSLESLWGRKAEELRDRLLEAATPSARFHILEQALLEQALLPQGLLAQAQAAGRRHPAVTYALNAFQAAPHDQTIAEVTRRTGLSPKWFIELFRAQVGLTPKLYSRLRRFQTALALIGNGRPPDWSVLAPACGYYDQAHFIRDFRVFSGLNPTEYLAGRGEHRNHVRLAD